jgi:hypothetical protein
VLSDEGPESLLFSDQVSNADIPVYPGEVLIILYSISELALSVEDGITLKLR